MSGLSGVAATFWMPILFSWHRGHSSARLRASEKWRQRCAVALSATVSCLETYFLHVAASGLHGGD